MQFVDEITIKVKSGHGGPGSKSFRRDALTPRGGPDGGNGGRGGNVIFEVDTRAHSLLDFRYKRVYSAKNGDPGAAELCNGKNGDDLILKVPPGTIIKNSEGEVLADLSEPGQQFVVAKGGRGGKGNAFFKTSVNQAPTHFQPGEPGEEYELKLELKLLANIGIVGFPNAGKSTLISTISAARPKVADYPFTTLVPNLGVVQLDEERSVVVADIPGLIPGAHEGAGLGIKFLKHIERTNGFIHLIDVSGYSGRDPIDDYNDINKELKAYDGIFGDDGHVPLSERPQLVVLNKIDVLTESQRDEWVHKFQGLGVKPHLISCVTGEGVKNLIYKLGDLVDTNS